MKQIVFLSALVAFGGGPAFEVASIDPCKPGTPEPPGEHMGMVQFVYPGGRFNAKATTVKFLIEWAYGILPAQHSGGPSWLGEDRYDIVAKAPGNATDDEMKMMAQELLADRFKLKFHREKRELPVLVVSLGKTPPKLTTPKEDQKRSLKIIPVKGENDKMTGYHVSGTRFSFEQLNQTFAWQLGRVLVNETGLQGDFNFDIDLPMDDAQPNPLDATHILNALKDQLGFVIKSQKAPVDIFVIDSAEKVAAGN